MKHSSYQYNRSVLLMLIFSINTCISSAQIPVVDSLNNEKIKNIAFGTQPSWMVTGSVSQIWGSELSKSTVPNIANALTGRLSGLTVRQSTGEPGYDSPILNSRGLNTFGSGNKLLIIMDGFEAPFEQLVPDEIESISLLKDASATAIYGNRAANGVLLVTTSQGKEGPLRVNFSAQKGIQQPMRLPDFLGSYDYARLFNEGLINDGKPAFYSDADLEAYKTGNDPIIHPDINWYDKVLRKIIGFSNYGLSFSGSASNVRYFGLINVRNNQGLYIKSSDLSEFSKNSNYTQYNFRTNIEVNLSKRLSATFILGGSVSDKVNPGVNETTKQEFDLMATIPPNAFPVYIEGNLFGGNSLYTNPLADIVRTGYYSSNGRTATTSARLSEELDFITRGLSISAALSFNTYFRSYSYKTRTYKRFAVTADALGNPIYTGIGRETSLVGNESLSNQWRNYAFQTFLNYNRTFGKSRLDGMIMFNVDEYDVTGSDLAYKHVGTGGRITYAYNEKYIGEFTFGYNGSENFSRGKRFGFFPAGSIGWILSNEEFLRNNPFVNYLKIKGSYGLVGNADIGGLRYMFDQYWVSVGSYYFGTSNTSVGTTVQGSLANPDVTWEKQKSSNIGLEATLFHRWDVSLDLFQQDRYDILATPNQTVSQYTGITLPSLNVGKVNNKGFEAMLRYNSNSDNKIQYFIEADAWYARNEILYNSEALQVYDYLLTAGHPVNQPFLLQSLGLFNDKEEIAISPGQIFTSVQPGDIKYKDQNGDNIIDQNDYYPIGYTDLPELTFALHSGIKYKSFELDILLQGITNRSVYLSGNYFYAFQNNAKISSIALDRWTPETSSSATYPRLSASNNLNNFQPSSFWQRDGSYIKLRTLELGYTITENIASKLHLASAKIYINGTNLFSFDHMNGFTDPEIMTGYPAVISYSLGIRTQF